DRVEPNPCVLHGEREVTIVLPQPNGGAWSIRVLGRILQCLERAEEGRGLDLLRVPVDMLCADLDVDRRLSRLRLQRLHPPSVGEDRWVDPAREVSQLLEGLLRVALQLPEN